MRTLLACAALLLLAGCSSPPVDAPVEAAQETTVAPTPVDLHEVVDLTMGAQRTWTFDVASGAKDVQIRFYATGKSNTPVGTGLPTCLSFETPAGQDSAGICQGSGVGNVNVSPYIVVMERVFYEADAEVVPGHYSFTLEAQPSASAFHALVKVQY